MEMPVKKLQEKIDSLELVKGMRELDKNIVVDL